MKRIVLASVAILGLSLMTSTPAEAGGIAISVGFGGHDGHRGYNRGGYNRHDNHRGHGSYRSRGYGGRGYGHGSYTNSFRHDYRFGTRFQPRHTWHDTSHYDYHPGYVVPHGNHLDYVPGHYDRHQSGHLHHNH